MNRSGADKVEKFRLGLCAKYGLVGRTQGAEHPVQSSHRPLAALACSLMLEIIQCI